MRTSVRVFIIYWLFLFTSANAFAEINISVIPVDGGSSLRFGRVEQGQSLDKEVTIRITSTEGKQYEVFQRILQPLVNERQEYLNTSVIVASSKPGSNGKGTLYLQNVEALRNFDQRIYTSNISGSDDSFVLFYRVNPEDIDASGNFVGRILYSVRPTGSNAQAEVVLNIFLDTPNEISINARASSGGDTIRLETSRPIGPRDYYQISFENNIGRELRIFQEVLEFPVSQMGETLPQDLISFATTNTNGSAEMPFQNATTIDRGRRLIYSSRNAQDTLGVTFNFDAEKIQKQAAGRYRAKIRYDVDDGTTIKNYDMNLEFVVDPIFKLELTYPQGGIHFDNLLPDSPPQTREVDVTVRTNLGKPYVIHQTLSSPLANESGVSFAESYFTMREETQSEQAGEMLFPDFKPVPKGENPLYYSDSQGSPVSFRVYYKQRPYQGMEPGNYKAVITYTLLER